MYGLTSWTEGPEYEITYIGEEQRRGQRNSWRMRSHCMQRRHQAFNICSTGWSGFNPAESYHVSILAGCSFWYSLLALSLPDSEAIPLRIYVARCDENFSVPSDWWLRFNLCLKSARICEKKIGQAGSTLRCQRGEPICRMLSLGSMGSMSSMGIGLQISYIVIGAALDLCSSSCSVCRDCSRNTQGKGRRQNVDRMPGITENSWGKTFAGTMSSLQWSAVLSA